MENKIIGSGRTSDVIEYNGFVLKLYKEFNNNEYIDKEYYFSKFAFDHNIKTPEPKQIIYENNRKGIVFEKINGKPLLKIILSNSLKLKQMIKIFVELQTSIHKIILNNSKYTFISYLNESIVENNLINDDTKAFLFNYIKTLPEGNNLCHGDFHPENILVDNNNFYIIDWMTGMQGNIAADVARTEMIIKNAEVPGNISFVMKSIVRIFQNKLSTMYIKEYCKINKLTKQEIDIWKLPLYVARLNEDNNKAEENRLLKYINKEIKKMIKTQ